jgi:hypothetical protein
LKHGAIPAIRRGCVHARALEERLKRERSILFDPPPGTWLLPVPVLKTYAMEWAWRMRWVLLFSVLFVVLFLLGPRSLPDWLRQFLYGDAFTMAMVARRTGLRHLEDCRLY